MRRVLLILATAALMMVLAATTVSPALAQPEHAGDYGYASGQNKDKSGHPEKPEYTGLTCTFGHNAGQRPGYGDPGC